jgi:hypothetical protein
VPEIFTERRPLCATAASTDAVPVPWQSGYTTPQEPVGVVPAWSSKPSQKAAEPQPAGAGLLGAGLLGGAGDDGAGEDGAGEDGAGEDGAGDDGAGDDGAGDDGAGEDGGTLVVGAPLQATPLSANPVGAGFAELKVPCKPNSVVAPAASWPFQATLRALTDVPVCVTTAFQALETRWSAP